MNSQYTPGPWQYRDTGDLEIYDQAGHICSAGPPETITDEDRANFRLIAAAPDLLEAARATLQSPWHDAGCVGWVEFRKGTVFDPDRGCNCYRAKLHAAVAKATGEQP